MLRALAIVTLRKHQHASITAGYGHVHAGFTPKELAKTIDALQAKFDVKSRVRHQVEEFRRHPGWLGAAAGATAVAATAVVALVVWRRLR